MIFYQSHKMCSFLLKIVLYFLEKICTFFYIISSEKYREKVQFFCLYFYKDVFFEILVYENYIFEFPENFTASQRCYTRMDEDT